MEIVSYNVFINVKKIGRLISLVSSYTMMFIISSGLSPHDPNETIFNSKDKSHQDNPFFGKKCDQMTLQLRYKLSINNFDFVPST